MSAADIISLVRDRLLSGGSLGIIVAAVGAAALVVLAVLLVTLTRSSARDLEDLLEERAQEKPAAPVWTMWLAIVVLLGAALVGGNTYLSRSEACLNCHEKQRYAGALDESVHKGVACIKCHAVRGPMGFARQNLDYARWIVVYGTQKRVPQPAAAPIDQRACTACHPDVPRKTLTANGIRVRHSDILEAGFACIDCHSGSAHTVKRARTPRMDTCVVCHDGKQASAECSTCHVRDVAYTPAVQRGFSKLKIAGAPDSCYQCHDEKPCLRCHGVRMPHPAGWSPNQDSPRAAGHARDGFANRRVCWRCHFGSGSALAPADDACAPCHATLTGGFHGGEAWVREHGLEATGQRSGPYAACFSCHDQGLCDMCHPSSYRARYDPNPAAPASPGYSAPWHPE
jgi:nitrate/TMAO reductase-like tetraheme cytochrome c subunit